MVWPLRLSAHQTHTKRVKVSKGKSVQFLHNNLDALIKLNPLVTAASQDPGTPTKYTIEDTLHILGYKSKINYTVTFTLNEHGVNGEVEAGVGTRTKTVFTVTEVEENVCDITMNATVSAYFVFMPYILLTQQKPHETLLDRLRVQLEGDS